ARRTKRINPDAITALIGCYAEASGESLAKISEIDLLIGSVDKESVVSEIARLLDARVRASGGDSAESERISLYERQTADTDEQREKSIGRFCGIAKNDRITEMDSRTRAYIKIEDGCDRYCSFCVIPYARGPVRSRPMDEILAEAQALIANGYKEIILTGVNAALYGQDSVYDIIDIVNSISGIKGDFRIRLGSLEPTVIDADYAKRLIKCEKLCNHLHLSLQSGSDRILKAMRRRYTMADYYGIIDVLRDHDPDYSVTTDMIVGFPGESEDDFQDSLKAVERAGFSRVHVFKYSKRKNTAAAEMPDQIPETEKTRRAKLLAEAGEKSAVAFLAQNSGKIRQTLLLEKLAAEGIYTGITDNDLEVKVSAQSSGDISNTFINFKIPAV
ncbi:MAG: MiaB/RimO family radical SAM methylthiotransferase, partial [Clostridiales Family XIII bacterium]|nr:MiaB/RimO family radical SAM methylthiotransferase [Clostridiales Family XIII bacterium]